MDQTTPIPKAASKPMIVDSHCHLDFDSLSEDRAGVLARAKNANIGRILTICTKISQFDTIFKITSEDDRIFCSVGVHPHEADIEGVSDAKDLIDRTHDPKVVGIGETGLDYFYEHSSRDAQRISFIAHIEAARETQLPLIVHARDADVDTMDVLAAEHEKGAFPGVIHCFTGSRALAEKAVDLGLYVSFSGILTFKNAGDLRDIARDLPEDRILVETDAPYLAPMPHRGKTNEPAFVVHTAKCLADVRGVSEEEIHRITTDNFFRLFNKVTRPDT